MTSGDQVATIADINAATFYGDATFYGGPGQSILTACGEATTGDGLYAAMPDALAFRLDPSGAFPPSWCGGWRCRCCLSTELSAVRYLLHVC